MKICQRRFNYKLVNLARKGFCEKKKNLKKEYESSKSGKFNFFKKGIPVKIYKKDNSYYISIKSLAEKSKILGVILSKQMREKHPNTWNNVLAVGVLFGCIFLFWWRLLDFKTTLAINQAYAVKPLITKKVAMARNLTSEDLNFIYERPVEYELDKEMIQFVEEYRKKNKLPINTNYRNEVKFNLVENPNRRSLF